MKLQAVIRRARMPSTSSHGAAHGASRAPVWVAALFWLFAAMSVVWWGLRWSADSSWQALPVLGGSPESADSASVARALGHVDRPVSSPAVPAASTRMRLLGVVAQKGQQGAALISVDGQPPRPYLAGSRVTDAWVLVSVERTTVKLRPSSGDGAPLELIVPQEAPR